MLGVALDNLQVFYTAADVLTRKLPTWRVKVFRNARILTKMHQNMCILLKMHQNALKYLIFNEKSHLASRF